MTDRKDGRREGGEARSKPSHLAEEREGRAGPGDRSQAAHVKDGKPSVTKSVTKPEEVAANDDM